MPTITIVEMNMQNEANKRSPILLRFIRNSKDSKKDDLVYIRPVWTPMSPGVTVLEFSINSRFAKEYTTTNSGSANKQMLTHENVKKYLYSLLSVVTHDDDPFVNVQIDIPNVPSILLEPKNIPTSIHMIMNLVDLTLYSWPVDVTPPALVTSEATTTVSSNWSPITLPQPLQRIFNNDRVESHY